MPNVIIVAGYCTRGYEIADVDAQSGKDLPVNAELADKIADWNAYFEDNCHSVDYEDVRGVSFDFVDFGAQGLAIARAVKRQLPEWTVSYFDEALVWYLSRDPRFYDPARAEYEVTLADASAACTK